MFQQLKSALVHRADKQRENEETGKIVDILKGIHYFKNINSLFGTQYLLLYVPLLQTFILRDGMSLIDGTDHYIPLQGILHPLDNQLSVTARAWDLGRLVDLKENKNIRFTADGDCKMLRIVRGGNMKRYIEKKFTGKEKEKSSKFKDFHKLIDKSIQLSQIREILSQIQFFQCLGEYDLLEMVLEVQLKEYTQGNTSHQWGKEVGRIGYILSGRLKVHFVDKSINQDKSLDRIVKKYKVFRKKQDQKGGVTSYFCEGDWVGLEQYLWQIPYRSNGQTCSIQTSIIWIPVEVFRKKFNEITNYRAITKLRSLIETKKSLVDRCSNTRRQKQLQIIQQTEKLHQKIELDLLDKIQDMQMINQRTNGINLKRDNKPMSKLRVPERVMHKINFDQEKHSSLPRLKQRFVLFPEQYEQALVSPQSRRELLHAEKLMQMDIVPKSQRTEFATIQPKVNNPQTIYKSLYERIAFKFDPDSPTIWVKNSNYPTLQSLTQRPSHHQLRTKEVAKINTHFNRSICNNFRVQKMGRTISRNVSLGHQVRHLGIQEQ